MPVFFRPALLACLAFAAVLGFYCDGWAAGPAIDLARIVQQIGPEDRLADDISKLSADTHGSLKLLVGELHSIPRKTYFERTKTKDSLHVIGCLRALHYLTGLTFKATSNMRLSDDERQFLDFNKEMHDENPGHQLHFFGVWMSRNADIVAPADAQRKIIEQWRKWAKDNADSFTYVPAGDAKKMIDQWYWFG